MENNMEDNMEDIIGNMRIVRLMGNGQFTHKVEIQRVERVSITIREQYRHQN